MTHSLKSCYKNKEMKITNSDCWQLSSPHHYIFHTHKSYKTETFPTYFIAYVRCRHPQSSHILQIWIQRSGKIGDIEGTCNSLHNLAKWIWYLFTSHTWVTILSYPVFPRHLFLSNLPNRTIDDYYIRFHHQFVNLKELIWNTMYLCNWNVST